MSKIYKIINDINEKIYIGKTEFSIEKRFQEHCKDAYKRPEEKRPLYSAIRKYGEKHFTVELIEECPTEEAAMREQYWIGFYRSYTDGYNATLGGDGKAYIDRSKIKELWSQGFSVTEISKMVEHDAGYLSHILRDVGIPSEEIQKRSKMKHGERSSKGVLMIDKNSDEILASFPSTREAARYLIQLKSLASKNESGYSTHISEVCRGKRKTCQGYKWKYSI